MRHVAGQRNGLTLIELVMSIAIVGIIVGATAISIREVISLWDFWSFRSETVSQGRIAVMRMVREIRHVNNETSILFADRTGLRFNDTQSQTIYYRLNGTDLVRNTDVLANGVTNLTFSYYNDTNAQLTALPLDASNRTDVYRIGIRVTISAGDQNRTLETQVVPRNL